MTTTARGISLVVIGLATLPWSACGSSSDTAGSGLPPGYYVTISNMTFSPQNLEVPPGATVTVVNGDSAMPHSVTSSASAGVFTPGAVAGVSFDTGLFSGQRTIAIPATAAEGTVIPYYCTSHSGLGLMRNPGGMATITIRAAATVSPGPYGVGGGGTGY
jgi:plastocyanin